MLIADRYACAVHSTNLAVDESTTYSDSDVIGAYGLAAKHHGLAVGLARLLAGDNHAQARVVIIMAEMARGFHRQSSDDTLAQTQADDMARAVLAWYRHGTCTACGGHGYQPLAGSPGLSDVECRSCRGTGRIPFEKQFHPKVRGVASWLLSQVERCIAQAGPEAMKALAPRLSM